MARRKKLIVVLKGYPRLSETFVAQELLGLEKEGFELVLVALRRPSEALRHPVHDEIKAPVLYLPEYLHEEPRRVILALLQAVKRPGLLSTIRAFLSDFRRDPSRNRVRRLGQALVLAAEWPLGASWLHAHFIHTPASVTAYASMITGVPWTCSAHAKDIWTTPEHELVSKLRMARWVVTCTRAGYEYLSQLAGSEGHIHLSYHGLDLNRFARFTGKKSNRDGSLPPDPVIILSVGRAVAKKGFDVLLKALALVDRDLPIRFIHVGGGEQLEALKAISLRLGLGDRVEWRGALAQKDVLALYRSADIFALACRLAEDGDRDGLPNVLVEACSQQLVCVSTGISGVPELLIDGTNGLVVPPDDAEAFAAALTRLIRDPRLRRKLGAVAEQRVREHFDYRTSIGQLVSLFEAEWGQLP